MRGVAELGKLLEECYLDRRKYIETFFKVAHRDVETYGRVEFKMTGVQRAYWERRGKMNLVLKARQAAVSSIVQADFVSEAMLTPGLNVLILVQPPEDKTKKIHLDRIKGYYYSVPEIMRPPLENENESSIVFRVTDPETRERSLSHVYFASAGSMDVGRGETLHRVHITEYGSWGDEEAESIGTMLMGLPSGAVVVKEGTPKGARGPFWREWRNAKAGVGSYVPHVYPWFMVEGYTTGDDTPLEQVSPDEARLMLQHGVKPGPIRWRRHQIRNAEAQWGDDAINIFRQEYLEDEISCWALSGRPVFSRTELQKLLWAVKQPVKKEGPLWTWLLPEPGDAYCIGVDPAEGLADGHASAATVRRTRTWEHCAELTGQMPPNEFAGRIKELATLYNGALVVPERNNACGAALILHLTERLGYRHIYRHEQDKQLGFPSNVATKPLAVHDLEEMIRVGAFPTWDERLVDQLMQVQEEPYGRPNSGHFSYETGVLDLVSAELVALQGRKQALRATAHRPRSTEYNVPRWMIEGTGEGAGRWRS